MPRRGSPGDHAFRRAAGGSAHGAHRFAEALADLERFGSSISKPQPRSSRIMSP
jgi:hypothetical protein